MGTVGESSGTPQLGRMGRNGAAVLVNLLLCLLLVKAASATMAPASEQGFVADPWEGNEEELGGG